MLSAYAQHNMQPHFHFGQGPPQYSQQQTHATIPGSSGSASGPAAISEPRPLVPPPSSPSSSSYAQGYDFYQQSAPVDRRTMEAVDTIIPDYDVLESDGSESLPEIAQGTEALAEATKNLIGLDSQGPSWTTTLNRVQKQISADGNFSYSPFARGAASSLPRVLKHTPFLPVGPHPPSQPPHYSFFQSSENSDPSSSQRAKRPSFSEPSQEVKRQKVPPKSPSPEDSRSSNPALIPKATLLTPSQKKANHIQSEQKRRANIKRGYETLCETIPALREAIRAEDEQNALSQAATGKKRSRSGKGLTDDGDKIDGRAGPRSENVVLQKTIDHLRAQLETRALLKERLRYAESRLPLGHGYRRPKDSLWERPWDGGKSVEGDEEHDSDEDQ